MLVVVVISASSVTPFTPSVHVWMHEREVSNDLCTMYMRAPISLTVPGGLFNCTRLTQGGVWVSFTAYVCAL